LLIALMITFASTRSTEATSAAVSTRNPSITAISVVASCSV
jgi:hypothetical protein